MTPTYPAVDFHMHTRFSADVMLMLKRNHSLLDNARAAAERGLTAIGITDHADWVGRGFMRRQNGLIETARQQVDIQILSGAEVSIEADGQLMLDDEVAEQIDYIVGSVHHVPGAAMHWEDQAAIDAFVAEVGMGTIIERLRDAAVRGIERRSFRILGHPLGLIYRFGLTRTSEVGYTDERVLAAARQIAQAAKEHNVALEMNRSMAGIDGYDAVIVVFRDEGAPISLGSDAHLLEHVGQTQAGIDLLRSLDVPESQVVDTAFLKD